MRNALLAVAAVLVVFLAGWIVDDKLLGGDVEIHRVEYLLEGGQRCAYSIRQLKSGRKRAAAGAGA